MKICQKRSKHRMRAAIKNFLLLKRQLIPPFEKGGIFRLRTELNPPQSLIVVVLGISFFALQASSAWAQHVHPTAPSSAPAIGNAAVPFDLKTIDGKAVNLDAFRGKPLVLNFFASWCDPCRDEMPLLNEIAAKAVGKYEMLGIAVEDTRAALTEFVKEAKIVFPVALDLNSTVKRSYRIFGPPATFFIDAHGIIQDVVLGPITADRAQDALKKARAGQ
jgi:peroxiredoxin